VIFLEAGMQILEVYRDASLRGFWCSPEILDRPRNWLPELMGCPQGPIRISQEFAGDDDCVRLSGTDDVLSLNRRCDHSDCTGRDVRFPGGSARQTVFDTRTDRNLGISAIAARRTINQVYSSSAKPCEWTQQQLAGDRLERAFCGSAKALLVGALSARAASKEELAEMRKLLDDFRKGEK
jgi:hypothetical protein